MRNLFLSSIPAVVFLLFSGQAHAAQNCIVRVGATYLLKPCPAISKPAPANIPVSNQLQSRYHKRPLDAAAALRDARARGVSSVTPKK